MIFINQSDEPRADRELEKQLRGLLGQRVSALRRVRLFIGAQAVFLRGQVRSFYIKQLLIHAVQRAVGQRRVIDEVSVLSSSDVPSAGHLHNVAAAGIALALAVFPVRGQIAFAGQPVADAVTAELPSMTQDGAFVPGLNVLPPVPSRPNTTTLLGKVESRDKEVPLKIVR